MSPFMSMPPPLAARHTCFPGATIAARAPHKLCAIHAHSATGSRANWRIRWNSPASAAHALVPRQTPISRQPGSPLAMRIGSFVLLQIRRHLLLQIWRGGDDGCFPAREEVFATSVSNTLTRRRGCAWS